MPFFKGYRPWYSEYFRVPEKQTDILTPFEKLQVQREDRLKNSTSEQRAEETDKLLKELNSIART